MEKRIIFAPMTFLVISLIFLIPLNMGISYGTTRGEVQSICGGTGNLNIRDSIVLSALTLCLPGIIEKAQEAKQIKCQTVKCKYDAVINGLDPAFCGEQQSYLHCKYVVGEVFMLPIFNFFEHLRNVVKEAIANPEGIAWSIATKLARTRVSTCLKAGCSSIVYAIFAIPLATVDTLSAYQQLKDISENGIIPKTTDYCDGIDEIKKQLEEVIKYK